MRAVARGVPRGGSIHRVPPNRDDLTDEDQRLDTGSRTVLSPSFGDRPAGVTLTGPPRIPERGGAPSISWGVRTLSGSMPDPRKLAVAALCTLPLAAVACGGGSDASSGGPGEQAYRQYACASCHSLDGRDGTGPTFKGLAGSKVTLEGGKQVTADAAYIEKAITDPDADITKGYNAGLMKASIDGFDLAGKPEEVAKLVEFIQSVK